MAWKRERRPGGGGATTDLPKRAIAADDSRTQALAQACLLLEAHAGSRLDTLPAALSDSPEAQRTLEGIFERVTLPLIDRIAAAGERER